MASMMETSYFSLSTNSKNSSRVMNYFFNKLDFLSSLRFTVQINLKYRDLPYIACPHTCRALLIFILINNE